MLPRRSRGPDTASSVVYPTFSNSSQPSLGRIGAYAVTAVICRTLMRWASRMAFRINRPLRSGSRRHLSAVVHIGGTWRQANAEWGRCETLAALPQGQIGESVPCATTACLDRGSSGPGAVSPGNNAAGPGCFHASSFRQSADRRKDRAGPGAVSRYAALTQPDRRLRDSS